MKKNDFRIIPASTILLNLALKIFHFHSPDSLSNPCWNKLGIWTMHPNGLFCVYKIHCNLIIIIWTFYKYFWRNNGSEIRPWNRVFWMYLILSWMLFTIFLPVTEKSWLSVNQSLLILKYNWDSTKSWVRWNISLNSINHLEIFR